jgi:ABC-type lipoprotein release transport system permease subunit
MSLWHCILREIAHRKLNFSLALTSALVAVACVIATVGVLRAFDQETDSLLVARQTEVEEAGKLLEDDVRKITKGLGFNILVLPKDQPLGDVYAEGYASKTMPEEYVTRLAKAPIDKIDHLLPALERKLVWPEKQRTILLVGIRGEVPRLNGDQKKPLLDPVPPGEIVLGHELHTGLGLKKGDELTLLGKEFTVATCYPQRGSKDDITAWIDLAQAQEMLSEPGRINAIWALECNCSSIQRLAEVRTEIAGILPDTQVIEVATQATARAEARNKAAKVAAESLAAAKEQRTEMRGRVESLAGIAVPVVIVACGMWIGLLALVNVRDRRPEIGILRALGLRSSQILTIFLGKAVLAGTLGAVCGIALGMFLPAVWKGETYSVGAVWTAQSLLMTAVFVLLGTPILAGVASWLPALAAAGQDPARILCEE